jgi:RsmE family RNA methyltransferase
MNLLIIHPKEISSQNRVILDGRRAEHLIKILQTDVNHTLRTGVLNGSIGQAKVIGMQDDKIFLELVPDSFSPPPEALPCQLILAMPRPKMMRRVLQAIAAMGVKEVHLVNCWKVDKSYWQTPWLSEASIRENLLLGLEQSVDTVLPSVTTHRLFKPFVEDVFPGLTRGRKTLLGHPGATNRCPVSLQEDSSLIVGPEGGFTDYEVEKLQEAGAEAVNLGQRILRVETAIPALLSRLYPA